MHVCRKRKAHFYLNYFIGGFFYEEELEKTFGCIIGLYGIFGVEGASQTTYAAYMLNPEVKDATPALKELHRLVSAK